MEFRAEAGGFGANPLLWYTVLVGVVLLCSILQGQMLWAFLEAADYAGEPFRWFEGLSMWPSELLRVLGFVLAVVFLFAACARSQDQPEADRYEVLCGIRAAVRGSLGGTAPRAT